MWVGPVPTDSIFCSESVFGVWDSARLRRFIWCHALGVMKHVKWQRLDQPEGAKTPAHGLLKSRRCFALLGGSDNLEPLSLVFSKDCRT